MEPELDTFDDRLRFYTCLHCGAHIGLEQQTLHIDLVAWNIYFQECINLDLGNEFQPDIPHANQTMMTRVTCHGCHNELGLRFAHENDEFFAYRRGVTLVYMHNLEFWNGNELQEIRAAIDPPVPVSPPPGPPPPPPQPDILAEPPQPTQPPRPSSSSSSSQSPLPLQ